MTLNEGRRVRLAAELRLTGSLTVAESPHVPADASTDGGASASGGSVPGSLSLAAGIEGTVERVDTYENEQSHEVREYIRLTSLLDDFGHQMPVGSRGRLEEQIASLEPAWQAYQGKKDRVTVRVLLDSGFVLDDVPGELFTTL